MDPSKLPVNEPLEISAPLALEWSMTECELEKGGSPGCAWYHGSWQWLRLLGLFNSLRSDDDFLLPMLQQLIGQGVRKVLVSGAADYALLARITAAAGVARQEMKVTVLDQCATPLLLNSWYGRKYGIDVRPVKGNILDFQAAEPFDLICTHSFICFFNRADRQRLVQKWNDCLGSGGHVITAQRARIHDRLPVIRYSEQEIADFGQRAFRLASEQFGTLGMDPGQAAQLAEAYGRHHWTHLLRTPEEISALFTDCGFVLRHFAPPGGEPAVPDTPGTPNRQGSVRWRVHAVKK